MSVGRTNHVELVEDEFVTAYLSHCVKLFGGSGEDAVFRYLGFAVKSFRDVGGDGGRGVDGFRKLLESSFLGRQGSLGSSSDERNGDVVDGGIAAAGFSAGEHATDEARCEVRGKHYEQNKRKRQRMKDQKRDGTWRGRRMADGSGGCVSDSSAAGTVVTVDSRTAEEIEAAKTLALRRVAENKVAAKLAEHRLRNLEDKTRTDVVERLAAARYEEKINGAKLRSQTSFKKCDDALKSLGSTGSAGEFALKQQIKDAQQNEALLKYVQAQCDVALRHVSDDVRDQIRRMPPPKPIDAFAVFGDCPSNYDEDEATAYYADLQRQNDEAYDKFARWGEDDVLFDVVDFE